MAAALNSPMMTQTSIQIRVASSDEDMLLAEQFYQMWRDLDVPATAIDPDWCSIVCQFITQARQTLKYQAFIAEVDSEGDRPIVGSASCQLHAGLYPNVLCPPYRQYGYIWGVYVEPAYRKQGIATQLTTKTIAYLQSIGCTHAILNASPLGQPVYERMGFVKSNMMQLKLGE
jgi:ribosomal protein S18 acetylase RimI-like enzyme